MPPQLDITSSQRQSFGAQLTSEDSRRVYSAKPTPGGSSKTAPISVILQALSSWSFHLPSPTIQIVTPSADAPPAFRESVAEQFDRLSAMTGLTSRQLKTALGCIDSRASEELKASQFVLIELIKVLEENIHPEKMPVAFEILNKARLSIGLARAKVVLKDKDDEGYPSPWDLLASDDVGLAFFAADFRVRSCISDR